MKKLINDPLKVADELVEGLVDAYNGECQYVGTRSIVKTTIPEGKVALLIGGGSGHEPIYHGLVGRNLADGAACGDIFAAPPPDIVLEATQAVDKGKGVLYLYGNYAGDVMNFDIGAELCEDEDIDIRTVLIWDDVCSAPPTDKINRRGVAGLVPIVKLAGAASQTSASLDELEARLRGRGTESEEWVRRRLQQAQEEMDQAGRYRFRVINDQVDRAVDEICDILTQCGG